ncbi:MAG: hypothetical protein A2231_04770 [Candidatus Firestonebacteria bacterium RIFOXYA2_FULL_40_8]|nr:MAG: hypothetical protein A2231_04770 [Candidatus Firestonebacteria bacterium RIFOXYA2_FULL_40_8]
MDLEACYKELGVNSGMTMDQIHTVYRNLCKKYHPDLYEDGDEKMAAHEKFIMIDSAYKTLLKNHIEGMEAKNRIGDMVDLILKKMELRMRSMDIAAGHLDNMFWGSVAGIGMLAGTGFLVASLSPLIGYSIVGACLLGLYVMCRIRR